LPNLSFIRLFPKPTVFFDFAKTIFGAPVLAAGGKLPGRVYEERKY